MSIDRISQYGGLYQNYKLPQIDTVSVEDVKKQDELSAQKQAPDYAQNTPKQQEQKLPSRMADLEDISLRYQNETYDSIGKDASLENLDVADAISDMQKDKLLQQYQYFVGPKDGDSVIADTADGMVIAK
jgi:hypothetical protein